MSDPRDKSTPHPSSPDGEDGIEEPLDAQDDEAVRALLKRTFAGPRTPRDEPPPDLLRGVQRKLRQRSKGKFYGDGWSTTQTRVNYALVALIMLVLVGTIYFVLGPMGVTAR